MLEDLAAQQKWERKLEPTSLPNTRDIKEFADELEKITRSKLTVISLFRQMDLQPLYAELERSLVEKAISLVNDLESLDDRAASKLLNLAKVLTSVQERNPVDLASSFAEAMKNKENAGITVNIANSVQ